MTPIPVLMSHSELRFHYTVRGRTARREGGQVSRHRCVLCWPQGLRCTAVMVTMT